MFQSRVLGIETTLDSREAVMTMAAVLFYSPKYRLLGHPRYAEDYLKHPERSERTGREKVIPACPESGKRITYFTPLVRLWTSQSDEGLYGKYKFLPKRIFVYKLFLFFTLFYENQKSDAQ